MAACSIVVLTPLAEAAPVIKANVGLFGINNLYASPLLFMPLTTPQPSFAAHGNGVITGFNGEGNPASMAITYDGAAEATADGILKARAALRIDNFFYNSSLNDPYTINSNFDTNPNGVPDALMLISFTSFEDRLSINGADDLDHITFSLHLDGFLNSDLFSFVDLYQGTSGPNTLIYSADGTNYNNVEVEQTITTNVIEVNSGHSDLLLSLQVGVILGNLTGTGFQGMDVLEGTADFYNTLTIGAVSGFDVNGNPVDLFNATTSSGHEFDVVRVLSVSVPEPWTISLLGFGLSAMALFRRQRFI